MNDMDPVKSYLLQIDVGTPTPDPVSRMRARIRRSARRRVLSGVAASLVLVTLGYASFNLHSKGQNSLTVLASDIIANVAYEAIPLPVAPRGQGGKAASVSCDPRALELSASSRVSQKPGRATLQVRLVNRGNNECEVRLNGLAEIVTPADLVVGQGALGSQGSATELPPGLPVGGIADISGTWENFCSSSSGELRLRLRFRLSSGVMQASSVEGQLTTDSALPRCQSPASEPTLSLYQLVVRSADGQRQDNPNKSLSVQFNDVPNKVVAGDILRFSVTLYNPTLDDIPLGDSTTCPLYYAAIAAENIPIEYQRISGLMNCSHAPRVIPPKKAVSFSFELKVPDDAALGIVQLIWRRVDSDSVQLSAKVVVLPRS